MRKLLLILISFGVTHVESVASEEVVSNDQEINCATSPDWDFQEDRFGPGNMNAVISNGRMVGGLSRDGDLTVFRWPTPSHFDLMKHRTPYLKESCEIRKKKYNGAKSYYGSFSGIEYRLKNQDKTTISWFRDSPWTQNQSYLNNDSTVVETQFNNQKLGLRVQQVDLIHSDYDFWQRSVKIEALNPEYFSELNFVHFENFNPNLKKPEYIILKNWVHDLGGETGVNCSPQNGRLTHFHLEGVHPDELKSAARKGKLRSEIYNSKGLFIALQTEVPWTKWNCSYHKKTLDNSFELKSHYLGEAAVKFAIPLKSKLSQTVNFRVFADRNLQDLEAVMGETNSISYQAALTETLYEHKAWLNLAKIPNTSKKSTAVLKRALLNIRAAFDSNSGGIVASLASQPTYNFVWPRDVAFKILALNSSGYVEMAEKASNFLISSQRDCSKGNWLCSWEFLFRGLFNWHVDGSHDMNYYTDGSPGGPIFFEIDNTALALWGTWVHSRYLSGLDKQIYINSIYPKFKTSLDALSKCRQKRTKLQCKAFEDDNPKLQVGLQGAITVYTALKSGIELAELQGDKDSFDSWRNRLEELEISINKHLSSPDQNHPFKYNRIGALAWMYWPAEFPMTEIQYCTGLTYLRDKLFSTLRKETDGGLYPTKLALTLAHAYAKDLYSCSRQIVSETELDWMLKVMLEEVSDSKTHQYGEAFFTLDTNQDGEKEFINRTSIPHVWAGTLNYLTAQFVLNGREIMSKTTFSDQDSETR